MIKHPIAIRKADILVAGAMEKKVNDSPIHMDGIQYGTGTLMFLCFSGALDLPSGLYRGSLCFEKVKDAATIQPGGVADFGVLFKMEVAEAPTEEVSHEL